MPRPCLVAPLTAVVMLTQALGRLMLTMACAGGPQLPNLEYCASYFSADFVTILRHLLSSADGGTLSNGKQLVAVLGERVMIEMETSHLQNDALVGCHPRLPVPWMHHIPDPNSTSSLQYKAPPPALPLVASLFRLGTWSCGQDILPTHPTNHPALPAALPSILLHGPRMENHRSSACLNRPLAADQ